MCSNELCAPHCEHNNKKHINQAYFKEGIVVIVDIVTTNNILLINATELVAVGVCAYMAFFVWRHFVQMRFL